MPKCRDNRNRKAKRRNRERTRQMLEWRKYCRWYPPYSKLGTPPPVVSNDIKQHAEKQSRINQRIPTIHLSASKEHHA